MTSVSKWPTSRDLVDPKKGPCAVSDLTVFPLVSCMYTQPLVYCAPNMLTMPARRTTSTFGLMFTTQFFWFVKQPTPQSLRTNAESTPTEIVFSKTIAPDVTIRARVDGLFEIELSGLPNCEAVFIPGYEINHGDKIPADHQSAEQRAYSTLLTQLTFVNAFKACFTSAMHHVQHHGISVDPPEVPDNYIPLPGQAAFDNGASFGVHPHLDTRLKPAYDQNFSSKTLVSVETLDFATTQFSFMVNRGETFSLLVDLLYHQHYMFYRHRFAECLIGAWSIIEAALFHLWETYLTKCRESGTDITRTRKQKLTGRDFTASIVQEILNLSGIFSNDEYTKIDEIRKARNNWIHQLVPVSWEQASNALQLCGKMISKAWGIELLLTIARAYSL